MYKWYTHTIYVCKCASLLLSASQKCRVELEKAQKKMTKVIEGMKQGCEGRETA